MGGILSVLIFLLKKQKNYLLDLYLRRVGRPIHVPSRGQGVYLAVVSHILYIKWQICRHYIQLDRAWSENRVIRYLNCAELPKKKLLPGEKSQN